MDTTASEYSSPTRYWNAKLVPEHQSFARCFTRSELDLSTPCRKHRIDALHLSPRSGSRLSCGSEEGRAWKQRPANSRSLIPESLHHEFRRCCPHHSPYFEIHLCRNLAFRNPSGKYVRVAQRRKHKLKKRVIQVSDSLVPEEDNEITPVGLSTTRKMIRGSEYIKTIDSYKRYPRLPQRRNGVSFRIGKLPNDLLVENGAVESGM